MKSDEEIRELIALFKKARKAPCNCEKTGHAFGCVVGGRMMDANIDLMLWMVGENPRFDTTIEVFKNHVARTGG